MQEYIIAFEGCWRHFFIKQHIGLCWRKKEGLKFGEYEVLLKGADADFCVYATDNLIHVICQDEKGSVLYLTYNGISWKKNILLESRMQKPYNKNFTIVNLSGYINLLYTISNKERLMLVHQIIMDGNTPTVVDYIENSKVPFCVMAHEETDFSVFYVNEKGVSGKKVYKWSQKSFSDFKPFESSDVSIKFIKKLSSERILAAAVKKNEKKEHLVCLTFEKNKDIFSESLICDDFYSRNYPVISSYGEKVYMVWTEYGNVVTSYLEPDGKWSSPMRYAKSSLGTAKLYVICYNGMCECFYGIPRENDITLYGTHDILKKAPPVHRDARYDKQTQVPSYNKVGDFKNEDLAEQEEQIKKLFEELSAQRNKLSELTLKIENIISSISLANDDDVDKILMN